MDRRLIIVARNQLPLCDHLRQQFFEDKEVEVLLDRRWRERRQRLQAHGLDRRRTDRRKELVREDLRTHGFAVIRRKPEAVSLAEIEELIRSLYNQIEVRPPGNSDTPIRGKSSRQARSFEWTPPVQRGGLANGNGSRKGKPESSVTKEEWQKVLEKVGIDSLRLPENGALCASWRRFLNELRGVT